MIEHYTNEKDFVARLGVLRFVKKPGDNEFVGKVFMRLGEGGHLFCQHYLGPMFGGVRPGFLDEVVVVEEETAMERAEEAGMEEEEGMVQSEVVRGRTVREVSRLWKYKDGRVPD